MKMKIFAALLCVFSLSLAAPLLAQPAGADEEAPDPRGIKAISLRFFGGHFSGATYLDLPSLSSVTYVERGSDSVYRYNGQTFSERDLEIDTGTWGEVEHYEAPRKEIEKSMMFGMQIGFYVNERFHLDIEATMAQSESITSFYNPVTESRDVLDTDDGFVCFTGGGNLIYDLLDWKKFGGYPSLGFGIGGIINRFSYLEDQTGLYFQFVGSWNQNLGRDFQLIAGASYKTFSFGREELQYGEQVTYLNLSVGISKLFDVPLPVD